MRSWSIDHELKLSDHGGDLAEHVVLVAEHALDHDGDAYEGALCLS